MDKANPLFIFVMLTFFLVFALVSCGNSKMANDKKKLEAEFKQYRLASQEKEKFTRTWEKTNRKLTELGAKPYVDKRGGGWTIDIAEDILFSIDSAKLNPNGEKLIGQIGEILNEFLKNETVKKTIRIVVGGHTDKETGTKEWNIVLSDQRAGNVGERLEEILKEKITVEKIGYGFRYPKKNARSTKEHRRITITIQPIAVDYLKK